MNKVIYTYLPVMMLAIILSGCDANDTSVNALLEHPAVLEKELQRCAAAATQTGAMLEQCRRALEAQAQLREYMQAAQADPERFGQRILDTELNVAQLKQQWLDSEKQLTVLQQEKVQTGAIQAATAKVAVLKKDYVEKQQVLTVLLAVAGLNSPE